MGGQSNPESGAESKHPKPGKDGRANELERQGAQAWSKNYSDGAAAINPRELNAIFEKLPFEDKPPVITDSSHGNRDLNRLDSEYIKESKKELDKIMKEKDPPREADLQKWLDKQNANTNPDEVAANLSPAERQEFFNQCQKATDALMAMKMAKHDVAGMKDVMETKVNLNRNLDPPPPCNPAIGRQSVQDLKRLAAVELLLGQKGDPIVLLDAAIKETEQAYGFPVDNKADCNDINNMAASMYQEARRHGWKGPPPHKLEPHR